jgi:hypothetical protein
MFESSLVKKTRGITLSSIDFHLYRQPFKGIYGAKLYVYAQGCDIKGGAPLFPFFQVK